jgi:hypothetical protein
MRNLLWLWAPTQLSWRSKICSCWRQPVATNPSNQPNQTKPPQPSGFIVAREVKPSPSANPPEPRRQRALEKVLDTAATSPYARAVRRWAIAGLGGGARVAAAAAARARSAVAGQVLVGYPLTVSRGCWVGLSADRGRFRVGENALQQHGNRMGAGAISANSNQTL